MLRDQPSVVNFQTDEDENEECRTTCKPGRAFIDLTTRNSKPNEIYILNSSNEVSQMSGFFTDRNKLDRNKLKTNNKTKQQ